EIDRDLVTGVAMRHAPDIVVEHGETCRKRGARRCVYRLRLGRATVEELARGACFCFWRADRRLDGTIFWGRPVPADREAMLNAWEAARCDEPHASIIDLRAVDEIPPATFAVLEALLRARREPPGRITACAVVRPPTLPGAVVTGALQMHVQ